MTKVMGIYVNFWNFYDARSPIMAMSSDTRSKFKKKKLFFSNLHLISGKGPVKLIKWVKIAHSFLQSVSYQFHIIILSLPM